MYPIEINERVWHFLQHNAEPFVDTPNSVLNRLLFGADGLQKTGEAGAALYTIPSVDIQGLPKSLSQILEVVYEMEVNGYSRIQATNRVAKKRGNTPQTITDKYCRQLGKRAHEIDELLTEPGYKRFKDLLTSKFSRHRGIIEMYFDSMLSDSDDATLTDSEEATLTDSEDEMLTGSEDEMPADSEDAMLTDSKNALPAGSEDAEYSAAQILDSVLVSDA